MIKAFIILLTLLLSIVQQSYGQKKDKRIPFEKIKFIQEEPHIMESGTWQKLLRIEDRKIDAYLTIAKNSYPTRWKFAFSRYLHYIMDEMDIKRGETLKVTYEKDHKEHTKQFDLTEENRYKATVFWEEELWRNRIDRKHHKFNAPKFNYLNTRLDSYSVDSNNLLSPKQVDEDLAYLEWEIVTNYAYANLRNFDYKQALDAIRSNVKNGITKRDFALQLKLFMANFGDGHSQVSLREVLSKEEMTSFKFKIVKDKSDFYAVDVDKNAFYKKDYPKITAINNIPIDSLYKIAKQFIPKTTALFVERKSMDYLNLSGFILRLASKENAGWYNVTFSNGQNQISEQLKLDRYGSKKIRQAYEFKAERIDENIGFIAMNVRMDSKDEFQTKLRKAMQDLKNTDGLIIDIRGNGGGSRAVLNTMLPYFIKKSVVVNLARYRVNKDADIHPINGYLERRFAFPEYVSMEKLNQNERAAIKSFKDNFHAMRILPDSSFSEWHYMVLSPDKTPQSYYYEKPVVLLIDEACFSASDIFAAGMKQADHVKLIGTNTGGGSGYAASKTLPNSHIKVRLSQMFSYQANGLPYDGFGVQADIQVPYTLKDKLAKTDSQRDAAIDFLKKQFKK